MELGQMLAPVGILPAAELQPELGLQPLLLTPEILLSFGGPQVSLLLLLIEVELVGHLRGLLVPSLACAVHLTLQLVVLEILGLLLGGPLELELGAGLDGLIVHLLEPLGRAVTAIDDLVDPVATLGRPDRKLPIRLELVQLVGVALERLEIVAAREVDDIGRGR